MLAASSIIILVGCQGALLTYEGAKVRDPYRVALPDGTQRSASYQAPDLIIRYEILRIGDELRLSGTAEYTPKIRNGYSQVTYFHLSVFLIDQYGKILQDKGIMTPGSDDPNNQMRFNEKIQLPRGTAYMAFSYNGQARVAGSRKDSSGETSFWDVPIVR